jgi:hypothetical protein
MNKDDAKSYDVIIVGAGPAGLACALELAETMENTDSSDTANKQFSVLIIDKRSVLGSKPCGGGICEKEVAVDYDPDFAKIISKQIIQSGNSKTHLTHKYKRITFEREDLAKFQEKTAFLPDYGFKKSGEPAERAEPWPAVNAGTSVSGIVGGLITLAVAGLIGYILKTQRTARKKT